MFSKYAGTDITVGDDNHMLLKVGAQLTPQALHSRSTAQKEQRAVGICCASPASPYHSLVNWGVPFMFHTL